MQLKFASGKHAHVLLHLERHSARALIEDSVLKQSVSVSL